MFDVHGVQRLTEWKKFRDNLEISPNPLQDLALFWSKAPFVSDYLNPEDPAKWPDPWHLVLDERLDNLAIALGMLYTLKLTQRFMDSVCEIHKSMSPNGSNLYFLLVDNQYVLNYRYREVIDVQEIEDIKTSKLYSTTDTEINIIP